VARKFEIACCVGLVFSSPTFRNIGTYDTITYIVSRSLFMSLAA